MQRAKVLYIRNREINRQRWTPLTFLHGLVLIRELEFIIIGSTNKPLNCQVEICGMSMS